VYQAWTDPEHLKHWHAAPHGFTVSVEEMNLRRGGKFRICMHSAESGDHRLEGTYREVVPPERLVFTHRWLEADGKAGHETLVTMRFMDFGGKTKLTLRQTGFRSIKSRDGHRQGWASTLDRLAAYAMTARRRYASGIGTGHVGTEQRVEEPAGSDREIVIARVVQASRDMVWKALTDPQQLAIWWGPHGFATTVHEMDLRPGGIWQLTMHGPDGAEYPNRCVFLEIVPFERIKYQFDGGKHGEQRAQCESTWTLEQVGEHATRLTIRMVFESAAERDRVARDYGAVEGGKQTLERLETHLVAVESGMYRSIVITRIYDAPPKVVFRAWIDPAPLASWWGPKGFTNPVCETDPRVGGHWRIVMRGPDGTEYPCGGVYREIAEPHRLTFTNCPSSADGKVVLNGLTTVVFEDMGGRTKLTLMTCATAMVDYAAAFLKGMEAGWSQSLDRLAMRMAQR
jgi:uncharacterized protein YndB with AHSA1/START domain